MKKSVAAVLGLLFAVVFAVSVYAQTSSTAAASANGINASFAQSQGITNLVAEATSIDRDTQMMALRTVSTLVSKGNLSEADSAKSLEALKALAYSGTVNETVSGMTVINSYPSIRMEACRLLGKLGGPQASEILLRVLGNDPEPMVLSEAAFQLGQLGLNPGDSVSQAIAGALGRQDALRIDNNLAFASLLAFENIAKVNKGITDPMVFDIIARIETSDYVTSVKKKAFQVMDELRSYN